MSAPEIAKPQTPAREPASAPTRETVSAPAREPARDNAREDVQTAFLRHVRRQRSPLTVFLVNGVKLEGVVTEFDDACFTLTRNRHTQLVYKHSVSTIMPLTEIHPVGGETKPLRPKPA